MATSYPTDIDTFVNPASTDLLENVDPNLDHDVQHTHINDAVLALETKIGKDGSAITSSIDYLLKNASSNNPGHTHDQNSVSGVLPLTGGTISSNLTVQGTLTTNLTANSIPFIGAAGLLTQDNTNLTWDNTNKWIKLNTLNGLRQTLFAAYAAYKVLQVGTCGTQQAISLGYNTSANSGGDITGNEIVIPNNISVMAANAANNAYFGILALDSSNILHVGSTSRSALSGSAIIVNTTTGYTGIGRTAAAGASTRLHVGPQGATTLAEGIQLGDDINLYRSAANTLSTNAKLFQTLPAAASVGITIKEAASQSANPFVLTNSGGTNLSVLRPDGGFYHTATVAYTATGEQHFGVGLYPQADITASDTFYSLGLIGQLKTNISTGITNSGYAIGLNFSVSRYLATDDGTLASQEGIRIDIGHNTGLGSNARTTACYGLRIRPYAQVGTIDTMYGIYMGNISTGGTLTAKWGIFLTPTFDNALAGNTRIGGTTAPTVALDVTGEGKFSDNVTLPKTSGKGLQVDPAAPTFGYRDITSRLFAQTTGANSPAWTTYRTSGAASISAYAMAAGTEKEIWCEIHIPHDYVPGTDLYLHVHWSQNVVDTGGAAGVPGVCEWVFDISYADGYGTPGGAGDPFTAPITTLVDQQGSTTQYAHMIAEVAITNAGGDATHLDRATIQVDGIILVRIHRDDAHAADTLNQTPFIHFADIHYQSTNMATKQKNGPTFYT